VSNCLPDLGLKIHAQRHVRILIAITGASGAIYTQRLLDRLDPEQHEVHVITSSYGQVVMQEELPEGLQLNEGVPLHAAKSMDVAFASGSNAFDSMVILPCTMGTLGRIAHGYSEDALLRAADVMLKENKQLILCPRETPLSLVHIRNMELLLQAGATLLPPNPYFYSGASTIEELADTVVARVLDHLGVDHNISPRWSEERD